MGDECVFIIMFCITSILLPPVYPHKVYICHEPPTHSLTSPTTTHHLTSPDINIGRNVTLDDLCFKPIQGQGCLIECTYYRYLYVIMIYQAMQCNDAMYPTIQSPHLHTRTHNLQCTNSPGPVLANGPPDAGQRPLLTPHRRLPHAGYGKT